MVDLGLALTWIAISAASAKGLTVFARAVATGDTEAELASLTVDGELAHQSPYLIEGLLRPSRKSPMNLRQPTGAFSNARLQLTRDTDVQ
jgi:cytochrome oxidase assembly protein ShyY1